MALFAPLPTGLPTRLLLIKNLTGNLPRVEILPIILSPCLPEPMSQTQVHVTAHNEDGDDGDSKKTKILTSPPPPKTTTMTTTMGWPPPMSKICTSLEDRNVLGRNAGDRRWKGKCAASGLRRTWHNLVSIWAGISWEAAVGLLGRSWKAVGKLGSPREAAGEAPGKLLECFLQLLF